MIDSKYVVVPRFLNKYFSDIELDRNIYLLLIWRFFILMVLFSACRLSFYLINIGYFPNTSFAGMIKLMGAGLVFDSSAILYTNFLYFLLLLLPFAYRYNLTYQTAMKYFFLITNGLALLANTSDFIYFQFGFRRTTASIFSEFSNENNLGALLPKFIVGYWYVVTIWMLMVAALYFLYGPFHTRKNEVPHHWKSHFSPLLRSNILLVIFGILMLAGIRGNFNFAGRAITLSNAGKYIREPLEANIVLNTPFTVFRTIGKQYFEAENYFSSEAEMDSLYTPIHHPVVTAPFEKQNVVVIILESFGAEYTKSYGHHLDNNTYQGYTPFLDSLIGSSRMYLRSYSNGRKSVDAMPSVLASIPMMEEPFLLTSYANNNYNSIASILDSEGYHTAYFHGAPNGSLGFDVFASHAGFQEYYGMNEYPDKKDFDGSWGIWDEEFLQFFAGKMNEFKQPFCTALFSVSSHHPFEVPEKYKGKFKKGPVPILQCISYTDYALKRFFQTASKMPWYKNTLFVITGDHTSQSSYLEYKTNIGAFKVPVIFFKPDGSLKGVVDDLAQQIDILPTVLGFLNYDKPYFAFGRNLLNPAEESFVITYTTNTYQLLMGDYLYLFNGLTETGLYNVKKDLLLSNNLVGLFPEIENRMEEKVRAFVQQYNNRMINNRLLVGK